MLFNQISWERSLGEPLSDFFNSFSHNKILDWSKLKGFAEDKIDDSEIEICPGKGRIQ